MSARRAVPALGLALALLGRAPAASTTSTPAPAAATSPATALRADPAEDRLFAEAAAAAWRYIERNYEPATGFVSATEGYPYATIWDIGSALAAYHSARELGMLDEAGYDRRVRTLLRSLRQVPLFDGAAYNKMYATRELAMARGDRPSRVGNGWSSTDLGRLLLWLRIVADDRPQYRAEAEAVVGRLDRKRVARWGYHWGATLERQGLREYQEGRVGYEQYAAAGFAAWGMPMENALALDRHGVPIRVMGHELLADVRGFDRLTSEPLVLMGLELGWDAPLRRLSQSLLAVQEERFRRTGRVTLVSEDAIARAPHYFYYYCVYTNAKEFATDVQDLRAVVEGPRWVSAKAAFAWHVLLPSDYTRRALAAVAPARGPAGWGSGVYEADGRSTGTANVNTQAVILTAAAVRKRGRPLLDWSRIAAPAGPAT